MVRAIPVVLLVNVRFSVATKHVSMFALYWRNGFQRTCMSRLGPWRGAACS